MKILLKNITDIFVWVESIQNIPGTIYSVSFMFLQPLDFKETWQLLPKACLEDWAVRMLSLQRCLVWSSVLVLSYLPVWSKPDQGNWSFPSWVALPKLCQAGQPAMYLLVPCSTCLGGFFFFPPTLLFSNSSCDATDVRKPNNNNQKEKKPKTTNSNLKPFNV